MRHHFLLRLLGFAVLSSVLTSSTLASPISIVLHDTGVTGIGVLAASGTADLHYSLISSTNPNFSGPAVVEFNLPGGYGTDGPNSQWIGPQADANNIDGNKGLGTYVYRTTFDLVGVNPATAHISGQWATDNNGTDILINGQSTGNTIPTTTFTFSPFSIDTGFVSGHNTLDFISFNEGGPMGLRVELSGSAALPEPGTLFLLPAAAVLLLSRRWLRRPPRIAMQFAGIVALCSLLSVHSAKGAIIADSVSDFSSTQGLNNWFYGYVEPATSSSFIQFPYFGAPNPGRPNTWYITPSPPAVPPLHVFTILYDTGGATNALITSGGRPVEQWADRRWVSTVSGNIRISGLIGDEAIFGDESPHSFGTNVVDGVVGQVCVNGAVVWSTTTDGFTHSAPYQVSAMVAVGTTVDFITQPRANDYSDDSVFTAQIASIPEPGTLLLLPAAAVLLCAWRRLRGLRHLVLLTVPRLESVTKEARFRQQLVVLAVVIGLVSSISGSGARADTIFVSNQHPGTIDQYTSTGAGSLFNAGYGTGIAEGLAFDDSGNLYMATVGNNSAIYKFTPGGVGSLFANTGLNNPLGIAVDHAGNVYVANLTGSTIEKFTPNGVGSVFAHAGVNQPYGLALDHAGNLFVANSGDNTIERFTPGGVGSVFASGGLLTLQRWFSSTRPTDPQ